jgi:hypothetical protein
MGETRSEHKILVQNPLGNCHHGRASRKLVNEIVRMGSRWRHNQKTEEVKELKSSENYEILYISTDKICRNFNKM